MYTLLYLAVPAHPVSAMRIHRIIKKQDINCIPYVLLSHGMQHFHSVTGHKLYISPKTLFTISNKTA